MLVGVSWGLGPGPGDQPITMIGTTEDILFVEAQTDVLVAEEESADILVLDVTTADIAMTDEPDDTAFETETSDLTVESC